VRILDGERGVNSVGGGGVRVRGGEEREKVQAS